MDQVTVLHERRYGRFGIFRKIVIQGCMIILSRFGAQYMGEQRRRLVVFSFDHIGHVINLHGALERYELETFFDWMRAAKVDLASGAAIDIGANIGNHALFFADYCKTVYCFEPNLRIFKVLCLNAELVDNVECFNVGISDSSRAGYLNVNPTNTGGATVAQGDSQAPRSAGGQDIELRTLDSMIDPSTSVKLIKIDVEGHEVQALLGSEATIRAHQPIILFEQHPGDFTNGASPAIATLRRFGYRKFATIKNYPRTSGRLNAVVRLLATLVLRSFFVERYRVVLEDDITPDFYPFIIAIPDWVPTES